MSWSSSLRPEMNAKIFGRSVSNSTHFFGALKSKPMPNKSLKFSVGALLSGFNFDFNFPKKSLNY